MGNALRDRRTPQELAASGQVIEIIAKVRDFKRLAEVVSADLAALPAGRVPTDWRDAPVSGRLAFRFADAQHDLPMLEGSVAVTVDSVCQRCLEAFRLPLRTELRLLFADAAGAATDREGYEVWELDQDRFAPIDLVDEALIMAMPLAAVHPDRSECGIPAAAEAAPEETVRPFADLRAQLRKRT